MSFSIVKFKLQFTGFFSLSSVSYRAAKRAERVGMIPTVEIGSFLRKEVSNDDWKQKRIHAAEELRLAFQSWGLAYLVLDDVEKGFAAKVLECGLRGASTLFRLPQSLKNSMSCPESRNGVTRGYLGMGSESGGKCFERKEAFSYACEWEGPGRSPSNKLEAENVWPAPVDYSSVKDDLMYYHDQAQKIMRAVAEALAMTWPEEDGMSRSRREESILDMVDGGRSISLMRCFHYFPASIADESRKRAETGSVQHTDWGFATLNGQQTGTEAALQVLHQGGWVDVPPVENTFVVNCGDFASLLSKGRLHSPIHRVRLIDSERTSVIYFQYPAFETKLPDGAPGTEHLSLLQNQSLQQSNADHNAQQHKESFGERIVQKWDQVARNDT